MRSYIVYRANRKIQDRYQLCRTCAIATRQLHISSSRMQDTINIVLELISQSDEREALSTALPAMQVRQGERLH